MKRIVLFLITNLAVMVVLSITLSLLGVNRFLAQNGLNMGMLLVFSAIVGFTGSFISLLPSKPMAKWTTGAFRDSALVAVSTGLLESMTREEVEAVLAHEVGHVANGDMVTLTLIQGVVNTFVVFLARVVGYFVDKAIFKTERGVGPGYFVTVIVCEILFGILASIVVAWFSRQREFRADAASAGLLGSPRPMIAALRRLGSQEPGALPQAFQAFGIAEGGNKFLALFSSHPPIPERIAALETARPRA